MAEIDQSYVKFRPAWLRSALPAIVALLALTPWIFVQWQLRVPADAAGLATDAARFLNGQAMSAAYFDNNPPLCFLIYLPAVVLAHAGVPLWHAITLYTFSLIGLGAFLVWRLLGGLTVPSRTVVFTGYLAAVTFPAFLEFGQKDHLIAIMLVPFLLAQWRLGTGGDHRKFVLLALVAGAPFVLIKPHYGLLPVAAIGFRFWHGRDFRVWRAPDFLVLTGAVAAYAMIVAIFLPDYVTVILPYAMRLYVSQVEPRVFGAAFGLGLAAGCCLTVALCQPASEERRPEVRVSVFLSAMALLAVVPFLAQLKGYSLHMLPALAFLLPAALASAVSASGRAVRLFGAAGGVFESIVIFGILYLAFPPHLAGRSAAAYQDGPLARLVRSNADAAGFYIQAENTNVVAQTALYTGVPQATRFPLLWFLPKLAHADAPDKAVFADAVAADLDREKPRLILLIDHPAASSDLRRIFGDDPRFAAALSAYRPAGRFRLDWRDYPADRPAPDAPPVDYDIFVRTPG